MRMNKQIRKIEEHKLVFFLLSVYFTSATYTRANHESLNPAISCMCLWDLGQERWSKSLRSKFPCQSRERECGGFVVYLARFGDTLMNELARNPATQLKVT